ncbi:unnamed protein product, partial [Laminaria digitata]
VTGNHVHGNGDAGMALMEIFNAKVSDNTFEDNKYGIRMSVGCADNVFSNNKVTDSTKYNVYTYEGSDDPWATNSGRSQDNVFSDNTITGGDESIKLTMADGTEFVDNTFKSAKTIRFEDAEYTLMSGNTGLDDADRRISKGACFDKKSDSGYKPVC